MKFIYKWIALVLSVAGTAGARTWELPVMVSWTEDPRTTATLAWERHEPAPARVLYREVEADDWQAVSIPEAAFRHVLRLDGLRPGTWHEYQVISAGGDPAAGRFWTAPDDREAPFSFVLHNDLQGGLNREAAADVAAAVERANPHFVLSTGDLAESRYARDYLEVVASWQEFFTISAAWLANSVFQPVAGNHDEPENPDSFWYRLFELPRDKRDYVFDVGPVRFLMLDSTESEAAFRAPWVARELQKAAFAPNVLWVVPAFHRTAHSYGERGGDGGIQRSWTTLFTRYEAGPVLSGHAHTYQRTHPIDGVHYLTSGGGGGRLYGVDPAHPNIAFATSAYHPVEFRVDGPVLHLAARLPDGTIFDRATYSARRHVRVEPIFPERGRECVIWYDPVGGPLEHEPEVWLYLGRDEFNNLLVEMPMQRDPKSGRWKAVLVTPESPKWALAFCFHNANKTVWHNNHGRDWQALLAREE